jgi:NAD(P)-dependent dehydrogenase (short-subunit alcohol dehydrogenase family)
VFDGRDAGGERVSQHTGRRKRHILANCPRPRSDGQGMRGTVDDIVEGVLYLETASFVTGEFLHVDGGQSADR